MVLTQFPDLSWLKKQTEERFANGSILPPDLRGRGWPNVILNVKSGSTLRDNIRGPLSVFANLSGESLVRADRKHVRIKEGFFFISNHDQHYTLEIEKKATTETCNVHFGEYFMDQVYDSIRNTPEGLLDNSFSPSTHLEFANQLYPASPDFANLLKSIAADKSIQSFELEEKLFGLAHLLLADKKEITRRTGLLPSVKSSTQKEIMRKLSFATDYLYSHYDKALSLDILADESQLSKFHFLRLFSLAFGQTPHQYMTALRLEKAKAMLIENKYEIKSIARQVGFVNASSLSRLFVAHTGLYPSQFIQQASSAYRNTIHTPISDNQSLH